MYDVCYRFKTVNKRHPVWSSRSRQSFTRKLNYPRKKGKIIAMGTFHKVLFLFCLESCVVWLCTLFPSSLLRHSHLSHPPSHPVPGTAAETVQTWQRCCNSTSLLPVFSLQLPSHGAFINISKDHRLQRGTSPACLKTS